MIWKVKLFHKLGKPGFLPDVEGRKVYWIFDAAKHCDKFLVLAVPLLMWLLETCHYTKMRSDGNLFSTHGW